MPSKSDNPSCRLLAANHEKFKDVVISKNSRAAQRLEKSAVCLFGCAWYYNANLLARCEADFLNLSANLHSNVWAFAHMIPCVPGRKAEAEFP